MQKIFLDQSKNRIKIQNRFIFSNFILFLPQNWKK